MFGAPGSIPSSEAEAVPSDTGPCPRATGQVETDASGRVVAYIVADDDIAEQVAARLGLTINQLQAIVRPQLGGPSPGETLWFTAQ